MLDLRYNSGTAKKIAELINEHNNLQRKYTAGIIINSNAVYYPIVISDCVLASVALDRLNFLITEVKHLVVPEALRGLGLAKRLLSLVIPKAETPYLIASVRSNNEASLRAFQSSGFSKIAELQNKGNWLTILGRIR